MNMKIKQQKQIEELLEKDFGMDKEDLLYNEENTILNDITKNIKDKSKKKQEKTLTQTILPRIALYKAMLNSDLSKESVYQYMQKYMINIVAKMETYRNFIQ